VLLLGSLLACDTVDLLCCVGEDRSVAGLDPHTLAWDLLYDRTIDDVAILEVNGLCSLLGEGELHTSEKP
jgi:hypothetical protein